MTIPPSYMNLFLIEMHSSETVVTVCIKLGMLTYPIQ